MKEEYMRNYPNPKIWLKINPRTSNIGTRSERKLYEDLPKPEYLAGMQSTNFKYLNRNTKIKKIVWGPTQTRILNCKQYEPQTFKSELEAKKSYMKTEPHPNFMLEIILNLKYLNRNLKWKKFIWGPTQTTILNLNSTRTSYIYIRTRSERKLYEDMSFKTPFIQKIKFW